MRGVYVQQKILGYTLPPPPPDVPVIEPDASGAKIIREQLAKHRENATCAACHQKVDPYRFAWENFDAIGRWRATYAKDQKIDPSDDLPTGKKFADVTEFRQLLIGRHEQITRSFVQKILTYAIGREPGITDRAAVDAIVKDQRIPGRSLRAIPHLPPTSPTIPLRPIQSRLTRIALLICFPPIASAGFAQLAPTTPGSTSPADDTKPVAKDQVVELSLFTVSSSGDRGDQPQSTLGGSRLRTDLKDAVSPTTGFTGQFFQDVAITSTDELASFSLLFLSLPLLHDNAPTLFFHRRRKTQPHRIAQLHSVVDERRRSAPHRLRRVGPGRGAGSA